MMSGTAHTNPQACSGQTLDNPRRGHRDVTMDDLHRRLGLVLQDDFLFADTVMVDIRYERLKASGEEVMAAAKLANADHFFRRLPQGCETVLTECGTHQDLLAQSGTCHNLYMSRFKGNAVPEVLMEG